jgi:hypothetical protein
LANHPANFSTLERYNFSTSKLADRPAKTGKTIILANTLKIGLLPCRPIKILAYSLTARHKISGFFLFKTLWLYFFKNQNKALLKLKNINKKATLLPLRSAFILYICLIFC